MPKRADLVFPAVCISVDGGFLACAAIRLRRLVSLDLYSGQSGFEFTGPATAGVADRLHATWTDLADAVTALPEPIELFLVVTTPNGQSPDSGAVAFLPAGRGPTEAAARGACHTAAENLWRLLDSVLDYAELEPVGDEGEVRRWIARLQLPQVIELRRRLERLRVSHGTLRREPLGFGDNHPNSTASDPARGAAGEPAIDHLFPWTPSDSSWRRLLETLELEDGAAALTVHARGFAQAPESCREQARCGLAGAESVAAANIPGGYETLLRLQAEALRSESLKRMAILEGRGLAARVFVAGDERPSPALVATAAGCIDDASLPPGPGTGVEPLFRGGVCFVDTDTAAVVASLDAPSFDILFGPREATAMLRTPIPVDVELPGIDITRARTAPVTGRSAGETPMGFNVHRSLRVPIALEDAMRFRHAYVVGQTGTGKSTLLAQMILADIRRGLGVAVLDPHGSLIDAVLERFPEERAADVVIIDPADDERPLGFNPLAIPKMAPHRYRRARDLLIDDMYAFLDRTYDMRQVAGPMFETHFRGMLALLLGVESPPADRVPNLMLFRSLYTQENLRNSLIERLRGQDPIVDDFVKEAITTTGDLSLESIAPYVTSKFTRFVADTGLRNITCQSQSVDVGRIVAEGKVLLFHLAKGRFGELAAGLLASQIVSKVRSAVMVRGPDPTARPFYLYADEFQLFADTRFAELLAEARKFRLGLVLAHQYLDQLPPEVLTAVLGNVGTVVSFRVSGRDAQELEAVFGPIFAQRDLASLPNFRACARSFGALGQTPFTLETQALPADGDTALAARIREMSRTKYGRDREEVEAEIRETYETFVG
jgi:hypothetical protein